MARDAGIPGSANDGGQDNDGWNADGSLSDDLQIKTPADSSSAIPMRCEGKEDEPATEPEEGQEPEPEEVGVAPMLPSPIAALEGLRRLGPAGPSTVDVILGDAGYSLAAWKGGEIRAFRSRRRDVGGDEAACLREEILRTAMLAGDGEGPRVRIVGPGSGTVVRALQDMGNAAEAGWQASGEALPVEAAEIPWLGLGL